MPSTADHGLPICFHPRTHLAYLSSERPLPRYSTYLGSSPHLLVFPLSHRVQEHAGTRAISRALVIEPVDPVCRCVPEYPCIQYSSHLGCLCSHVLCERFCPAERYTRFYPFSVVIC